MHTNLDDSAFDALGERPDIEILEQDGEEEFPSMHLDFGEELEGAREQEETLSTFRTIILGIVEEKDRIMEQRNSLERMCTEFAAATCALQERAEAAERRAASAETKLARVQKQLKDERALGVQGISNWINKRVECASFASLRRIAPEWKRAINLTAPHDHYLVNLIAVGALTSIEMLGSRHTVSSPFDKIARRMQAVATNVRQYAWR